jgi:hypothetical protein
MRGRSAVGLVACALLVATACRGPRPRVLSSSLRASADGRSAVEAVVENAGGGEGEVRVEVTLRLDDAVVERTAREVRLRPHERVLVRVPVDADAKGPYRVEVSARYPVD